MPADTPNKRYYWMKFQRDFFGSLRIKRLRKLAGGDTFTIIYLKLQLLSITTGGYLEYKGICPTFAEEMATEIDEDIDNVSLTIEYLLKTELMKQEDGLFYLPYAAENIGSETASAQRVREHRKNQKLLHCNTDVTDMKQPCNVEIEIEKEIEIDIKESKERKAKRFSPPSISEVREYCTQRGNNVDAESFVAFYESKNWYVGKNKMVDWKAAVITWEKRSKVKPQIKKNTFNEMIHTDYDFDEIERRITQ